ncbi:MAG TPA: anthranilate synthase component I [Clostridiales bacterium]|nr:anthranilate synthase component I [Clostridiales bacterium]
MVSINYEELKKFEKEFNMIPVSVEIMADSITPITLLRKIAKTDNRFYLLESVEQGDRWGRYSFLGYNPMLQITCKEGKIITKSIDKTEEVIKDPMEVIRELLNKYSAPSIKGMPPFTGGFVGYFSYNMLGYEYPETYLKANEFNDFDLMIYDKVIAFDHLKQKIIIIANYKSSEGKLGYDKAIHDIEKIIEFIRRDSPVLEEKIKTPPKFKCNIDKEKFCEMVDKAKEYISKKQVSQVVISRRFEADYYNSLLNSYRVLRTTNPSPYMYYLKTGDIEIAGASPETLVKLVDGRLQTFPIAGTRHRGQTEKEDLILEKELLQDKKELSEHNMLVDLAKEDLSKVSLHDSIEVENYLKIHRFSKVMHIVSEVVATIRKDKDACDTISAMLPAGTLSGSPKTRAFQIIEELEPISRGIYGGAIGYIDFSGNLDVCITIRTAVKKDNKLYIQSGCGIVEDSIPTNEYEETENKAAAIIEAVKLAGEVI